MLALLDGDIYAFRSAAASENESLGIAKSRVSESIENTLANVDATEFKIFISGSDNFRYKIYPEYKANRRNMVDPRWREALKEYLITEWKAEITYGIEADDALGIEQMKGYYPAAADWPEDSKTIISTIDKDLDMIPGWHYNFVRNEKYFVDDIGATHFFYKQLLMGDRADNIIGLYRVGPKTAEKMLAEGSSEAEWFEIVRNAYNDDERMLMNARVLWIWQKDGDDWLESKYGKILNEEVGLSSL